MKFAGHPVRGMLHAAEELRKDIHLAVQHHPENNDVELSKNEVPGSVDLEADDRIAVGGSSLPPDEQRQTDREDARECDDQWIGKPVIAFAAAEDDLERCKPSDQQEEANHVEWTGTFGRLH